MTDIDLNALSLAELKQLEKNLAKAIASFEDRRKAEARAAAEAVAKEHGFSLGELAEMTPAQKRATVAPTLPAPPTTVTLRFIRLLSRRRASGRPFAGM